MSAVVEVTRGPLVESRHVVHVAVAEAGRGTIRSAGDPAWVSFVRSAIKMFQALPLVEDGVVPRLGLTPAELALCTASHNAEPVHVATARSILAKAGVSEDHLACGPHPPMLEAAADTLRAAGDAPGRIHNNCSGKHAGMLALAHHHGWALEGYHRLEHPVQQRVLSTLAAWSDMAPADIGIGVDGCGLPTFALPLDRVALACARFAAAGDGAPASTISRAMMTQPELVAGQHRLCTALMAAVPGRLFAKVGAEGYYCAGLPARRLGIAIKAEDGARRAAEVALLAVLRALGAISQAEHDTLREYARPAVTNTRGEVVGEIRATLQLE